MKKKHLEIAAVAAVAVGYLIFSDTGSQEREQLPMTNLSDARSFNKIDWPPPGYESQSTLANEDLTDANFYVVFDGSGSMEESECAPDSRKIEVAKTAVKKFAASVPQDARLGLFVFDENGTTERTALDEDNRKEFAAAVNAIQPGGGTPLRQAISDSLRSLGLQAASQLGYGEYHLVIITDGLASRGQDPTRVVAKILGETPITIHTIGFCIQENHPLNIPGHILYKSAANPEQFEAGLQSVLAEAEQFQINSFDG